MHESDDEVCSDRHGPPLPSDDDEEDARRVPCSSAPLSANLDELVQLGGTPLLRETVAMESVFALHMSPGFSAVGPRGEASTSVPTGMRDLAATTGQGVANRYRLHMLPHDLLQRFLRHAATLGDELDACGRPKLPRHFFYAEDKDCNVCVMHRSQLEPTNHGWDPEAGVEARTSGLTPTDCNTPENSNDWRSSVDWSPPIGQRGSVTSSEQYTGYDPADVGQGMRLQGGATALLLAHGTTKEKCLMQRQVAGQVSNVFLQPGALGQAYQRLKNSRAQEASVARSYKGVTSGRTTAESADSGSLRRVVSDVLGHVGARPTVALNLGPSTAGSRRANRLLGVARGGLTVPNAPATGRYNSASTLERQALATSKEQRQGL